LQRYELGQLTVVATVWDVSPPRAMLEDRSGMGYIITLGTPIGRNGGVVTAIEPRRVLVEERVLDYYGREQINRVVMETPSEEGPGQPQRERK
jgi:type IV pilus assembly protein PilP